MTMEKAERIINNHRNEKYYSVSCLQVGNVEIINVLENGFTFIRKTEYVETFGIYEELYETSDIHDVRSYNIVELVTKRFK